MPWHPLICHMLDVANVATELWKRLPDATRRVLSRPFESQQAALAWLPLLIALHDAGKALPGFQSKWCGLSRQQKQVGLTSFVDDERYHHSVTGTVLLSQWLQDEVLLGAARLDEAQAECAARAVAAHHGHFCGHAEFNQCFAEHVEPILREKKSIWAKCHQALVRTLMEALEVPGTLQPWRKGLPDAGFVVALAGLTTVADWLGSNAQVFSYEALPVDVARYQRASQQRAVTVVNEAGWRRASSGQERSFVELFPQFSGPPRPLQVAARQAATALDGPGVVIIESAMGDGKTEAALLAADHISRRAGQGGLFVGLPTQATSNQMLGRVRAFLEQTESDPVNLHLVHGDAALSEEYQQLKLSAIYGDAPGSQRDSALSRVAAEQWFCRSKRGLLATHAVGTADQGLLGVLRTRHSFVRLFGLAGKTVLLDEVHAYDTYTSTLLDRLVAWLARLNTTVIILSATLPRARRLALLEAYGAAPPAIEAKYPRVTAAQRGKAAVSHPSAASRKDQTIRLQRQSDDTEQTACDLLDAVKSGGCAAWICNTVGRAQAAFCALKKLLGEWTGEHVELDLSHSRLLRRDRQRIDKRLAALYGPGGGDRPRRGIVVGTQVLEQSLDFDFDTMVSDLAPIDLLLQRAGRLHRHSRPCDQPLRRARPAQHADPVLWLVMPQVSGGVPDFGKVAGIYALDVMCRTWCELRGVDTLRLPQELEAWVERVYGDTAKPLDEALARALSQGQEQTAHEKRNSQKLANQAMLFDPAAHGAGEDDDAFGSLASDLIEDEGNQVHRQFRAVTRLAPPSVDVVCLWRHPTGLTFDEEGTRPAALPPGTMAEIRELILSSVRLPLAWLSKEQERLRQPEEWRKEAALKFKWLLELEVGVPTGALRLDKDLGIIREKQLRRKS